MNPTEFANRNLVFDIELLGNTSATYPSGNSLLIPRLYFTCISSEFVIDTVSPIDFKSYAPSPSLAF